MRTLAAIVALLSVPVVGTAQRAALPPVADSSAMLIMTHAAKGGTPPWLQGLLRHEQGASQGKMNEIADSLTNRALGNPSSLTEADIQLGLDATNLLMAAGMARVGGGQPYAGALERLIRVHQKSAYPRLRRRALVGIIVNATRDQALDYLKRIVESSGDDAALVVEYMIGEANGTSWSGLQPTPEETEQAKTFLNALVEGNTAKTLRARDLLERWHAAQIKTGNKLTPPRRRTTAR